MIDAITEVMGTTAVVVGTFFGPVIVADIVRFFRGQ